jgi:hypothetical protein
LLRSTDQRLEPSTQVPNCSRPDGIASSRKPIGQPFLGPVLVRTGLPNSDTWTINAVTGEVAINIRYNSAHMKRRRLALAAAIIALISASAFGYGLKKRRDQRVEEQKREEKRKASYGSALSFYSKDLDPGMTRSDVERYLGAKAISYQRSADADLIKIGQEAAPWFCSEVNVYVAFDFEAIEPHDRP